MGKETIDYRKSIDYMEEYRKMGIPFHDNYLGPEIEARKIVKLSLVEPARHIVHCGHTTMLDDDSTT